MRDYIFIAKFVKLVVSRSSVLPNIHFLPTVQLSLSAALYSLHLVLKTSSWLLVIKSTFPRVACWVVLFIAFPASLFSTFQIFMRSCLLQIHCLLAFGRFKPAIYCSFLVLRCLQSTARISLFDSCFRILILISHTLLLAAQCFPYALLVISWMLLTGHILLTALFYFAVCWY